MNPKVDFFFGKSEKWKEALLHLRRLLLECGLTEELKWGVPCYTEGGRNIVLVHAFKEYCAVLFFKGALLADHYRLLVQQTENVQAARQLRYTSANGVVEAAPILKAYVYEAIEVEKAGLKVEMKKAEDYPIPEELRQALAGDQELAQAFDALTPGRRRAYILHFSSARQAATRTSRIGKCRAQILMGKGLNE